MQKKIRVLVFFLACFSLQQAVTGELKNQLAGHPSPYLAMHAHDPVKWQKWGPEVLQRAQQENRLIFISSGYFSCHWCHVMQRESYSNKKIAAFLNKHFIPVKVDRELRPALDAYLIDFVERTKGSAGWPLNIFLTPEGYPFFGLTYAGPERFLTIMQGLSGLWAQKPEKMKKLASEAAVALLEENLRSAQKLALSRERLQEKLLQQVMDYADDMEGGFGNQSRFPRPALLQNLLDSLDVSEHETLAEFLHLTLKQMADRGFRDHLYGGFFRYTVDPAWLHPHFEKMLYTQALLIPVYLKAADVFHETGFADVARDTLDFVLEQMSHPDGGYIASFSAVNDQGEEGALYLWKSGLLKKLLTDDEFKVLSLYWNLQAAVFDAGSLPVLGHQLPDIVEQTGFSRSRVDTLLLSAKSKLRSHRAQTDMSVDFKVLTAWNGLMLSAISRAADYFNDKKYRNKALQLKQFLLQPFVESNRLSRFYTPMQKIDAGRASLEDYAYVAQGLSDWLMFESDAAENNELLDRILSQAWSRFHDVTGWRAGDEKLLPAMPASMAMADAALPAPDAIVTRLSLQSANQKLQKMAQKALKQAIPVVSEMPFTYSGWVRNTSLPQALSD